MSDWEKKKKKKKTKTKRTKTKHAKEYMSMKNKRAHNQANKQTNSKAKVRRH